jgi:hypothetical protein
MTTRRFRAVRRRELGPIRLVRLDGGTKDQVHGWQARVYLEPQRHRGTTPYASRYFADRKHGGAELALKRARAAITEIIRGLSVRR